MVRLTAEDKEEIRKLHFEGKVSYRTLGKMFGIATQTAFRVCNKDAYEKQLEKNRQYKREDSYQKDKEARRHFRISFSKKNNPEIIEWLEKKDNLQKYVQGLIEEDMARAKEKEKDLPDTEKSEDLE